MADVTTEAAADDEDGVNSPNTQKRLDFAAALKKDAPSPGVARRIIEGADGGVRIARVPARKSPRHLTAAFARAGRRRAHPEDAAADRQHAGGGQGRAFADDGGLPSKVSIFGGDDRPQGGGIAARAGGGGGGRGGGGYAYRGGDARGRGDGGRGARGGRG